MVFWPYHHVEEDERKPLVKTTSKSDVEHGRTLHHSPARCLPTRADVPHACPASSSPGWIDPTHVNSIMMNSSMQRMMSAWCNDDVSMSLTSQHTCQHSGTHLPRHQPRAEPSQAELSRAELEPSRAASRRKGFSVAAPTCNRIWDGIWAVDQARIVLIKS